jgi:hypothetical protein
MARRSRVEINRAALGEIQGGLADGCFDVLRAIVRVAESRAPDQTPYGEGLVQHGGAIVWADGRQVHRTTSEDGPPPKKPRQFRVKSQPSTVSGVAGFSFPGGLQEGGTVHHPAQPFFTPSAVEVLGAETQVLLSAAMERRFRGERSANTFLIAERKAAARSRKAASL